VVSESGVVKPAIVTNVGSSANVNIVPKERSKTANTMLSIAPSQRTSKSIWQELMPAIAIKMFSHALDAVQLKTSKGIIQITANRLI
jgi:hypothetical protein